MHSLEPEISGLRDDGVISAPSAARLIAYERREIVSIYSALRFLIWGGVMLIATGVGILVSKLFPEKEAFDRFAEVQQRVHLGPGLEAERAASQI